MIQPKPGQLWIHRSMEKYGAKRGLLIIRDNKERYFRYVAYEYLLMLGGEKKKNGSTVALSATNLNRNYFLAEDS